MKITKRLLGFRSGTPWKSIVAAVYYLMCVFILIVCWITPPLVPANLWDTFVVKISLFVIFVWMISPALFLSNTPFRDKLPLFKKHVVLESLIGMSIVFFLFSYLFTMVENLHSTEYKEDFQQYIEMSYSQFAEAGEDASF